MTVNIIQILIAILLTTILAIVGYWLRTAYTEFKGLLKELTGFINELKSVIVGIQTQIEKGIEADINEIKADITKLQEKATKMQSKVSVLNQKCNIKE